MSSKAFGWKKIILALLMLVWCFGMTALAEGASGDNSLYSLGITTEGATISPEFLYSTIEYNVTVPAGTTELSLDPVTSNPYATITDISGTTLNEDGTGTVVITVMAENGSAVSYYLYVKPDETAAVQTEAVTEKETEPPTEKETEPETEDPRYVKVDRNSLAEAENTISTLKAETANYRDRQNLLTKILYGMIAFCVVLLFVVINLLLKKKDLKAELKKYQSYEQLPYDDQNGYGQSYDQPYGGENGYDPSQYGEGGYEQSYTGADSQGQSFEDSSGAEYGSKEPKEERSGRKKKKGWNSETEGQVTFRSEEPEQEKKAAVKDDPTTVPKPSKAKKQPKKMPEYQQPKPTPEYQPQPEKAGKDVEVTMIDL